MKRNTSLMFLLCLLTFTATRAGGPDDYYRKAEGLQGTPLKTALHDLIQPRKVLGYGSGTGKTWGGFWLTDQMDDLQVRDRYSNITRQFNPDMSAVDGMNIEHIWANSWWGHLKNNAYCDLFNLYPADATANGRKSNNPIGIVDENISFDNGIVRVGKSRSYRTDSIITVWEPADEWKGDFARTYFYMATCYSHMAELWTTAEGLLTVDPTSPSVMRPWVSNLMLQWAEADPVDQIEQQRNDAIYGIQGNRNPFVDFPELAWHIWADKTHVPFYCDEEHGPEIFVPLPGEELDFGLQPLSRPFCRKVQVRGRGLEEGITAHIESPRFTLDAATLSAQAVRQGTDIAVSVTPTEEGTYASTLVLSGSNYVQQTPVRVEFVDGIPAYSASDIVCSVSSRRFDANWMNYLPGADYTLRVYTKDANDNVVPFGTYTTIDTTYQVKNVQASTTYYYRVSTMENGQEVTSNEVAVHMPDVVPVFSVSTYDIALTATPGKPSASVQVSVTMMGVPNYSATVSVNAPFELSTDGTLWAGQIILTGQNPTFLVRFAGAAEEGDYAEEITLCTEGLDDRIVSVGCNVDEGKAFFEDFEVGSKAAYAASAVTCSAATWEMSNALIAADPNALGKKCVRMKGYVKSGQTITTPAHMMMLTDKENGCDSLWFCAGSYGNDTGVRLSVSFSPDGGKTWQRIVSSLPVGEMRRYGYKINANGTIRLKFESENTGNKRVNIDNVQMSDWEDPDGIESIHNSQYRIDNNAYDLGGRRVTSKTRGIVIERGKKSMVTSSASRHERSEGSTSMQGVDN